MPPNYQNKTNKQYLFLKIFSLNSLIALDSAARGTPGHLSTLFSCFNEKKAPPFGGAKCLRGAHLHEVRNLVVSRVGLRDERVSHKGFVLIDLRHRPIVLDAKVLRDLVRGGGDAFQQRDIGHLRVLRDILNDAAHDDEDSVGVGWGGVRMHA
jgi:hypothetical protein